MHKYFVLIILWAPCFLLEEEKTLMSDVRKVYGMSYNDQGCTDYIITFKCMTACKSKGFYIFRLNYLCKCTCHDVSTSNILPYFKWRTTRPTRTIPKTQSVSLYHIIGTLSPAPTKPTTTSSSTTAFTCPPVLPSGGSDSGSGSGSGAGFDSGSGSGAGFDSGSGSGAEFDSGSGSGSSSISGSGSGDGSDAGGPDNSTESTNNEPTAADEKESHSTPSA